ncbi:MAG: leucine-rich repeat domain-containing protein, partial [Ruminococcus sp.]|nr:leucine-rich repeat domain-containing protein [Candidatus Copronaster equi]
MKKHIKRTFLILIIAIYLVTACIPLTASAIDEYAVFALNFISQEDEYVTLSVGLSFESFSKADIRVEPSDKNAVCTEIKETDDFVSLCESLNDESHIALYQMNPETKSVSLSSTSTFNKLADYFIYTFKMPNKDKITKYDFTLSVNGIEYDVINNLPKDDTEKASGDFTYIVKNGEAVIVSFNKYFSGVVEIPSEIDGYTVTKINPLSFIGCSGITSITIPESVTEIGCYAFADCSALQEAKINGKITSINNNTFENCTNLKNVNIPQTVEQIGDYAFAGCSSITEITLPDKLTSLGEYAFYRCGSLKDIVIPDYVEKISAECFNGCSSLSNVMIGSSVKTIEYFAFYNCVALTTVEIKSDIDLIQISAFNNCPYISKIYVAVSSELWNDVKIEEMNTSFSSAKFYYDIYFMNGHHY